MEKRPENILRIVVTGPECTGKTTVARYLGRHYKVTVIPEYARDYISGLGRPYGYEDVAHVARHQIEEEREAVKKTGSFIILDTHLVITRVWFEVVFGKVPGFLLEQMKKKNNYYFLLCNTDIEWVPDDVRENGGEMRETLFQRYHRIIEHYGWPYDILKGTGEERYRNALKLMNPVVNIQM